MANHLWSIRSEQIDGSRPRWVVRPVARHPFDCIGFVVCLKSFDVIRSGEIIEAADRARALTVRQMIAECPLPAFGHQHLRTQHTRRSTCVFTANSFRFLFFNFYSLRTVTFCHSPPPPSTFSTVRTLRPFDSLETRNKKEAQHLNSPIVLIEKRRRNA